MLHGSTTRCEVAPSSYVRAYIALSLTMPPFAVLLLLCREEQALTLLRQGCLPWMHR